MRNGISITEAVSRFIATAHETAFRPQAQNAECAFTLGGKPVPEFALAAANGLMPVLVWHAESLHRYLTNTTLNPVVIPDPEALLGYSVNADDCSQSSSELLLYVMEAMQDIWDGSPADNVVPGARDINACAVAFREAMRTRATAVDEAAMQPGTEFSV